MPKTDTQTPPAKPRLAACPKKPSKRRAVSMSFSIPFANALIIDAVCKRDGLTRTEVGKQAIQDWLDAHGYTQDWLDSLEPEEERELY